MTLILSGTNGVSDIDGDASTPAVRGTDANSGIFFGADTVGISAGGTQKLSIGTGSATVDGLTVGQGAGSVSTNTAVGASALAANTTGANNVAVGYQALDANTTGIRNTAVGSSALGANTTANNNNAFGFETLTANTTGAQNNAFGNSALGSNTTGGSNDAFGYFALVSNTTGGSNVAMGREALEANTTGENNTAVGRDALTANTTGANNTAVGYGALDACTTGGFNVALGSDCGGAVTTGNNHVFIGRSAGTSGANPITTGNNDIYIGYLCTPSAAAASHELIIGTNTLTGKGSNTGFIGANNGSIFQENNSSSWATTSDQRLKKNIVDNNIGLEVINAVRVRNFEYRLPDEVDAELKPNDAIKKTGVQIGVIAQEFQQVLPDCVKQESTGVLSVDSDNLIWHMINAIKELSAQVTALQAEVNTLKGQ